MDSTSGIVHNSGVANGDLVHLPLKEVHVNSSIIDSECAVNATFIVTNMNDSIGESNPDSIVPQSI